MSAALWISKGCSLHACPCGMLSDPLVECVCSEWQVRRYRHKISGPLLDRMDMHIEVARLRYEELTTREAATPSVEIAARVDASRQRQRHRFVKDGIYCNAQMGPHHVQAYCELDAAGRDLLRHAFARLHLSARAYDRILKVARTIADLAGEQKICPSHLAEAIGYRQTDYGPRQAAAGR